MGRGFCYTRPVLWLVRSAICAIYPRTDDLPGAEDCDLDAYLRRLRAEATPLLWLGIVLGALVFHATPLFTVLLPLPAFLLPRALRDRHASAITGTSFYLVRQSVFLVKLAAGLCWGGHPSVRARLALPPHGADPGTWRSE